MPLLLPADNASLWTGPTGNNTWLLRGRVPVLVDAGVGARSHLEALESALGGSPLAAVLVTHGHVDHVSGVAPLKARWPSLRVRQFGGDDGLADGERVPAGDSELLVLHTPGHSPDHCCFLDPQEGDVYCGDLMRLGGTVVIPASRGGDLAAYLRSLEVVRKLEPRRLFPGHGPIIEDPAALIDEYVQHRAARDEQILSALTGGPRTSRQIADVVYRGLRETLKDAAAETVLAHLIKMRDEGRVREDDGKWMRCR
jgi:glyoxylase-like metal-dependent hydrolase (beta-lactamase superfamily II)